MAIVKNEGSERFFHWFGLGLFQSSSVFCHSLAMRLEGWFGARSWSVAQGGGSGQQREVAQKALFGCLELQARDLGRTQPFPKNPVWCWTFWCWWADLCPAGVAEGAPCPMCVRSGIPGIRIRWLILPYSENLDFILKFKVPMR